MRRQWRAALRRIARRFRRIEPAVCAEHRVKLQLRALRRALRACRRQRTIVPIRTHYSRRDRRAARGQRQQTRRRIRHGRMRIRVGHAARAQLCQRGVWMHRDPVRQVHGMQSIDAQEQHTRCRMVRRRMHQRREDIAPALHISWRSRPLKPPRAAICPAPATRRPRIMAYFSFSASRASIAAGSGVKMPSSTTACCPSRLKRVADKFAQHRVQRLARLAVHKHVDRPAQRILLRRHRIERRRDRRIARMHDQLEHLRVRIRVPRQPGVADRVLVRRHLVRQAESPCAASGCPRATAHPPARACSRSCRSRSGISTPHRWIGLSAHSPVRPS